VTPPRSERRSGYYDLGMPSSLVVAGRLWDLLLALATVALIFATARLLFDTTAGVVAGLMAAAAPALATRSAIVTVHTPATTFVAAVAWLTIFAIRHSRSARWWAFAAGCAAGAATTSMYVAGAAIVIPVVAVMVERDLVTRDRVLRWIATISGFVVTVVLTMPAFVVHPRTVWSDIRAQGHIYATRHGGSYLIGLTDTREFGPLLAIAALVGLVVLVRRDASRVLTIAWLSFAVFYVVFLERYHFQPAQTLLPIYPFSFVAAGVAVAWGRSSRARRLAALGIERSRWCRRACDSGDLTPERHDREREQRRRRQPHAGNALARAPRPSRRSRHRRRGSRVRAHATPRTHLTCRHSAGRPADCGSGAPSPGLPRDRKSRVSGSQRDE
jgi:hypothetical protein